MQENSFDDEYLDTIQEKILILLSQHEKLEPEEISRLLGASIEFILFHLECLKKSSMTMDGSSSGDANHWKIIEGGRAYLIHHGMLCPE